MERRRGRVLKHQERSRWRWQSSWGFYLEDEEDKGKEEGKGASVLLQDHEWCRCVRRWLQVEEIWTKSGKEHPASQVRQIKIRTFLLCFNKLFEEKVYISFDFSSHEPEQGFLNFIEVNRIVYIYMHAKFPLDLIIIVLIIIVKL